MSKIGTKRFYDLCFSLIVGLCFNVLQEHFGFRNLDDGIVYYAEVHNSFQNKIFHTIGMPFTMLGGFLWVPALLFGEIKVQKYPKLISKNFKNYQEFKSYNYYYFSEHFRNCFMLFYIGMYLRISWFVTFLVVLLYYPSYYYSMVIYKKLNRLQNFVFGLSLMVLALYFQEIVGHRWGEDPPSRIAFDPIFNAVCYAPYFSVSHFF